MKFCKDCKWRGGWGESGALWQCYAITNMLEGGVDLVTGEPLMPSFRSSSCAMARSESSYPTCGAEARWFEPKEGAEDEQ